MLVVVAIAELRVCRTNAGTVALAQCEYASYVSLTQAAISFARVVSRLKLATAYLSPAQNPLTQAAAYVIRGLF